MSMNRKALFYDCLEDGGVLCRLCHHACHIQNEKTGFCGVRSNNNGVMCLESYGMVSSYALDPIEKKPLYHFHPGSMILSIGNFGCNFRCSFCQNHGISMKKPRDDAQRITPEQLVLLAEGLKTDGNIGAAYTYNEPLIAYEFILDCAKKIHDAGMVNIFVTNGCINEEPFNELLPYADAFNIDLKSFNEDFYKTINGDLNMVMRNIALAAEKTHLEVTNLVIPGENDSEYEMEEIAKFLSDINPNIPLHLSRFFPRHQMTDKPATPKETIWRLKETAERYLNYVYAGNMR